MYEMYKLLKQHIVIISKLPHPDNFKAEDKHGAISVAFAPALFM